MIELALLIPIIAILGSFVTRIITMLIQSMERRHKMTLTAKNVQVQSSDSELKALRAELSAFKDSSTQYDMSLDQLLLRLEHRIDRIEKITLGIDTVPRQTAAATDVQEPYKVSVTTEQSIPLQIMRQG